MISINLFILILLINNRHKSIAGCQMKWRSLLFVNHVYYLSPMIVSFLGIVARTSESLDVIEKQRSSGGMSPLAGEMQGGVVRRVDRPNIGFPLEQQF